MVVVRQRESATGVPPNNPGSNTGSLISNGVATLCPPGCKTCTSNTVCTVCNQGFILLTSTSTCGVCGPRCTACSNSDPNSCTACRDGAFLSGTQCNSCASMCISCNGNATSCSQCPPGQFFASGQCSLCQPYCRNCTSSATCVECIRGFTLTVSNPPTCRRCSTMCSSCNPSNIT